MPKNFVTTKLKIGKVGKGTTFSGSIPYVEDAYDGKKKFIMKEIKEHHEKVGDRPPFSQMAGRLRFGTFMNPRQQIALSDAPLPPVQGLRNVKSELQLKKVIEPLHDKPFKPANPGKKNHTLAPFPGFMPDPPRQPKRMTSDSSKEDIPAFKPSTKIFSRPTPSVATNSRNLKA